MLPDIQPEASTSYRIPTKHILSPAHLAAFRRSPTHQIIVDFIDDLNDSVVGQTLTGAIDKSGVRAWLAWTLL